ncbi:MAG: hypothetical protein HOW73_00130 [Polyangiaceae bacterium]|nr:hypothetical protein [Polyangiaceae bacterium]
MAIAAGDTAERWLLLGAPAAVAKVAASDPTLAPVPGVRASGVGAVALANGGPGQTVGLLALGNHEPLTVLSTDAVRRSFLEGNVLARSLAHGRGRVEWVPLRLDERCLLFDGLTIEAVAVPGARAPHARELPATSNEDNVAFVIEDARGKALVFAPAVGGPSASVDRLVDRADVLLFDGTHWSTDQRGAAPLREHDSSGHWPLGGAEGSLLRLAQARGRRILVHVDDTNPILLENSAERVELQRFGVEVAWDQMEITL